jgi:hypothetical protein
MATNQAIMEVLFMSSDTLNVGLYFYRQGYQVLPYEKGSKHPFCKNWSDFRFKTEEELTKWVESGNDLGLLPNNDFIWVDLDTDHGDYDGRENYFDFITNADPSIFAYKPLSDNLHIFYKPSIKIQQTGDKSILEGVEISSQIMPIRINGSYIFQNLYLDRPFINQLYDLPDKIIKLHELMNRPVPIKNHSKKQKVYKKHNIVNYLKKVAPFEDGGRSTSYRKLIYTMVVKNGMPYELVKPLVDKWDQSTIDFASEEPYEYEHATRYPS